MPLAVHLFWLGYHNLLNKFVDNLRCQLGQPGHLSGPLNKPLQVSGFTMAVFRVERNKGYTVMSNHHLRNKELSLKAKGLLSQMLSLPEDWDYFRR